MVNNSTKIKKKKTTNNHLSPQATERPRHVVMEIHVLVWDRHKYVAGLNR
jgi:hypothetical protein